MKKEAPYISINKSVVSSSFKEESVMYNVRYSGTRSVNAYNLVAAIKFGQPYSTSYISSETKENKSLAFDVFTSSIVNLNHATNLETESRFDFLELAAKCVYSESIIRLAELYKIPISQFIGHFSITDRTLRNYTKNNELLDSDISEKVIKLFHLYLHGCDVFGNSESFTQWIRRASYGLHSKEPLSLLHSSTGIDLINDELHRIEYGDFS